VTRASHSLLQPPRWTHALLLLALPCDPMRDAILGDLHEEFLHDVVEVGARRARVRHVSRAAGIAARALSDSVICRSWVSTEPAAEARRATVGGAGNAAVGGLPHAVLRRARAVVGAASFTVLALFVVVVGVVVNTMLFSAAQPQSPRASAVVGIGGVALLLACVIIAAIVMCAGPRWRRKRLRGA
jgi:hypothetical protein